MLPLASTQVCSFLAVSFRRTIPAERVVVGRVGGREEERHGLGGDRSEQGEAGNVGRGRRRKDGLSFLWE